MRKLMSTTKLQVADGLTALLAALVFPGAVAAAKSSECSEFAGCPEVDNTDERIARHLTTWWWESTSSLSGLLRRDLERTKGIAQAIRVLLAVLTAGLPTIESSAPDGVETASDEGSRGFVSAWKLRLMSMKAGAASSRVSGRKELVPNVAVAVIPGCA
jgi:hypothetical protein